MQQVSVSRAFAGAVLWLVSFDAQSSAFVWSADSKRAAILPPAAAFRAAALARDAYGAAAIAEPSPADAVPSDASEPVGVATRAEFRRIRTADVAERGPHCAEHAGFTDGCAGCYSVHAERAA